MQFDAGAWAEHVAAGELTRLGCHVYFPRAGQPPADLVFTFKGKPYTAQIKYSSTGRFDLRHRSHTRKYVKGTFDYFVLVWTDNWFTQVCMIPANGDRSRWNLSFKRLKMNSAEAELERIRAARQSEERPH